MKETTDLSVLHTKLRLWLESCQTEANGHIAHVGETDVTEVSARVI